MCREKLNEIVNNIVNDDIEDAARSLHEYLIDSISVISDINYKSEIVELDSSEDI